MQKSIAELGVKVVEPCKMLVAETKSYEIGLYRTWEQGVVTDTTLVESLMLFRVTLDGIDTMVLAESEEGAIGQASCQDSWKSDILDPIENKVLRAIAYRMPLMIRGWGQRKF